MDYTPQTFDQFIGQEKIKAVLSILCKSAKKQQKAVCHVLLSGPPGLGKTTLARLLANEMGSRIIEIVGSNIQSPDQIISQLIGLQEKDIFFIDEIHSLNRACEEVLYSAMQDRRISIVQTNCDDLMKSIGLAKPKPTVLTLELPEFTLLGASTLSGLVSAPLRSRFTQNLILEPYNENDLQLIVLNASKAESFRISKKSALSVARRSRSCARTAIQNLRWLIEYSVAYDCQPTEQVIEDAFSLKEIDEEGLTKLDRKYLSILVEARRPVGVSTLVMALGESQETIERSIEPFLFQRGYIRKGTQGRVADQKAFDAMSKKRMMRVVA